ncbi:bifunctional glycosyltransferase 87/phosphatase PAP2 family protein, partial [Streptomyces hainanensis]
PRDGVRGRTAGNRLTPGLLWLVAGALTAWQVAEALRRTSDGRLTDLGRWLTAQPVYGEGGFTGTPVTALLLDPLLDPLRAAGGRAADLGWTFGTLLLLAAFGLLVARAVPGATRLVAPAVLILLALSRPARELVAHGGFGLPALVLALAGWLLARRHQGRGGALIGLGAAFQPTLLLFAALLWCTGGRRAARATGVAFAGATALAWAARPADSVTYWLHHTAGVGLGEAADGLANQSLHGALLRLGLRGPAEVALFLVLAAVVCGVALRRATHLARDDQRLLAAGLVGCAALAITPAAWASGQLWLLAALAGRAGRRIADRPVWPALVALVLVFDGTVLVPKLDSLAPIGENAPLLVALAAAGALRFLPRASPLWDRPVRAGAAGRPNLLLELLLIRVGYFCYSWVRSEARGDRETAEAHGHQILDIERALRIDMEHGLNHAVADVGWLADAMDFAYASFHFAVPLTILGWLLVRHPAAYRAGRRALALTTLLGLVGFWLYPLAPPRLMPDLGYIDTANGVQDLDDPRYGALTGITNPYAAMPSLHVGWSLWCAVTLWRTAPYGWLRVAGFGYPLLTTVVIMGTGNHYLLDAAGGALVVLGGFAASRALGRAFELADRVPPPTEEPGEEPGERPPALTGAR